MDVLAVRVVDAEGQTLDERVFEMAGAARDSPTGSNGGSVSSQLTATDAGTGDAAQALQPVSTPSGGWQPPLSLVTLRSMGAPRQAVVEALTRAGGTCVPLAGGFRGAAGNVCRGLGTRVGLAREAPEVNLLFDQDRLASVVVGLGSNDDEDAAVADFRRDVAYWSTRFSQQPPEGRHDGPEVIRYRIGENIIRLALVRGQGGQTFTRMLLVESVPFALRQDAISRGAVPGVVCGTRGSLDERVVDCARPVNAGGVGPAATRTFRASANSGRRFDRYHLVTQTADGARVWYDATGRALLASVMEPATAADAGRRCGDIARWTGLGGFGPPGVVGLQPSLDGGTFLADLFPELVSPLQAEWLWSGASGVNEQEMLLGDGYGLGERVSFTRVTRGSTANRRRYVCMAGPLVEEPPASRVPPAAGSDVVETAPCGLSGDVVARTADCRRVLGPLASAQSPSAPSGGGDWELVAQSVTGNRVWREPGSTRMWFYVPDAQALGDSLATCRDPQRAATRRVNVALHGRLPTGVEYREAWSAGLFHVMGAGGRTLFWSGTSRPGRRLVQTESGGVLWYEERSASMPRTLPFYCVADVRP